MKPIKLLGLLLLSTPMLAACGETYDVTMSLAPSSVYVYDNGAQDITFAISERNNTEFGVGWADNVGASCIKDSPALAGKALAFNKVDATHLTVTFSGDSTYNFAQYIDVEFVFQFTDAAFNKTGFHDMGTSLHLIRSHAEITSTAKAANRGAFGFKLVGTTFLNYEAITVESLQGSGLTITAVTPYDAGTCSVRYEDPEEGATVTFPKSLFANNQDLVIGVDNLVITQSIPFAA